MSATFRSPFPASSGFTVAVAVLCWVLGTAGLRADYRTDVGYDALQAELGAALPTGAGLGVSQIEAPDSSNYLPDTNLGEFAGKTFTIKSGSSGVSGHATTVGQYFYGAANSLAPGVSQIDLYEVNSWLQSGSLNWMLAIAPKIENRAVTNHSWVGSVDSGGAQDVDILRRFDYSIQRDDFVAVVALNNGGTVPQLLGCSYNGIVVGVSQWDSAYSPGTTVADGLGRVKPDLVSPLGLTSYATPTVAAAAASLLEKAGAVGPLADAQKSVTVKAILMAGATKSQFPTWDRTTTRPLDETYGAGQVNIYRSYHVLVAGPQGASASVSVRPRGWDYRATPSSGGRLYFFDIAPGNSASGFSAVLTWNRIVGNTAPEPAWGSPSSTLPNLSLKLYAATAFTIGALIDSSVSPVDNVEHLYAPALAPGRYALEVTSDTSGVNYGLAWDSRPTVTIAATTPAAAEQGAVPGGFTITRAGETLDPLTVNFTISGSALNGADYTTIPTSVTLPVGASTAVVTITPVTDALAEGAETVTLTVAEHLANSLGGATTATVTIADRPFDAWRFQEFTSLELGDPQISGENADPDADGLSNLAEYAFLLAPKTPSTAGLPVVGRDGSGALTLSYALRKSATDITAVAEISTDFSAWHSGPGYTAVQSTDQGATWGVVATSLLSPVTEPRQFMRVRITRP